MEIINVSTTVNGNNTITFDFETDVTDYAFPLTVEVQFGATASYGETSSGSQLSPGVFQVITTPNYSPRTYYRIYVNVLLNDFSTELEASSVGFVQTADEPAPTPDPPVVNLARIDSGENAPLGNTEFTSRFKPYVTPTIVLSNNPDAKREIATIDATAESTIGTQSGGIIVTKDIDNVTMGRGVDRMQTIRNAGNRFSR